MTKEEDKNSNIYFDLDTLSLITELIFKKLVSVLAFNKIIKLSFEVVVTTASKLKVQRLDSRSDKNLCNNSCITTFV